jgi:hypothetical protein
MLVQAVQEMSAYFAGHIEHRKTHPTDDLISTLMKARDKDGNPLEDSQVLGSLRLLLIAGIDTTWSAIGSSLWHLANTPADRDRLIAEPELMPTAIEELLRAYSPVTMAREVMKETTVSGCPVKPGNMVLLSFPAANRDPAMFPDADKVVIDRKENRHAAFGLGIHRCVGSNLARMEMTVAIEEWPKADSGLQARTGRQGHLVGRHGARSASASRAVRQRRTERSNAAGISIPAIPRSANPRLILAPCETSGFDFRGRSHEPYLRCRLSERVCGAGYPRRHGSLGQCDGRWTLVLYRSGQDRYFPSPRPRLSIEMSTLTAPRPAAIIATVKGNDGREQTR